MIECKSRSIKNAYEVYWKRNNSARGKQKREGIRDVREYAEEMWKQQREKQKEKIIILQWIKKKYSEIIRRKERKGKWGKCKWSKKETEKEVMRASH